MKKTIIPNWLKAITIALPVVCMAADESPALKTQQDRDSYAIGSDLAKNLKRQGVAVDYGPLLQGMRDALAGDQMLMTDDELRETLRIYQLELRKKRLQTTGGTAALAEDNRETGVAFLAENKDKEGVVTMPSGLQYKIIRTGDGPKPAAADTVEYKFRGSLIDGFEFNSTNRTGKPLTAKVGESLAGLKEAMQLMPLGSKWVLYIPSQLAYGEKGVMGSRNRYQIPPNATLILEVDLLAIKPSTDQPTNTPQSVTPPTTTPETTRN